MDNLVIIVDYDNKWPSLYEKERQLIGMTLEHRMKAIEHIGSTAVPNLGGKNIIDIMVGVNNADEANECLFPLEEIGYKDVTPQPNDTEWYYCLGKRDQRVRYHLHLVKFNGKHWKKHIIFRDFLRRNPEVAQVYFNLKKELAAKYGTDRLGYTEAKSEFIKSTISRANQ